MGNFFQSPAMDGERPFLCYNCGKKLISSLTGDDYRIDLYCPRCKAKISVRLPEPVPEELAVKLGSLLDPLIQK